MISLDTLITIFSLIQPLLIGFIVSLGIRAQSNFSNLKLYSSIREKSQPSRLYECSTYSRLNSKFTYQVWTLGLLVSFLVYDIDVLLIVALVSLLFVGSVLDLYLILTLLLGLGLAVAYDQKTGSFS